MAAANYLELWYAAAASPHGIRVHTDDPNALRQRLYAARTAAADPTLDNISLVISPINPDDQLWLVKRQPDEAK